MHYCSNVHKSIISWCFAFKSIDFVWYILYNFSTDNWISTGFVVMTLYAIYFICHCQNHRLFWSASIYWGLFWLWQQFFFVLPVLFFSLSQIAVFFLLSLQTHSNLIFGSKLLFIPRWSPRWIAKSPILRCLLFLNDHLSIFEMFSVQMVMVKRCAQFDFQKEINM